MDELGLRLFQLIGNCRLIALAEPFDEVCGGGHLCVDEPCHWEEDSTVQAAPYPGTGELIDFEFVEDLSELPTHGLETADLLLLDPLLLTVPRRALRLFQRLAGLVLKLNNALLYLLLGLDDLLELTAPLVFAAGEFNEQLLGRDDPQCVGNGVAEVRVRLKVCGADLEPQCIAGAHRQRQRRPDVCDTVVGLARFQVG